MRRDLHAQKLSQPILCSGIDTAQLASVMPYYQGIMAIFAAEFSSAEGKIIVLGTCKALFIIGIVLMS